MAKTKTKWISAIIWNTLVGFCNKITILQAIAFLQNFVDSQRASGCQYVSTNWSYLNFVISGWYCCLVCLWWVCFASHAVLQWKYPNISCSKHFFKMHNWSSIHIYMWRLEHHTALPQMNLLHVFAEDCTRLSQKGGKHHHLAVGTEKSSDLLQWLARFLIACFFFHLASFLGVPPPHITFSCR